MELPRQSLKNLFHASLKRGTVYKTVYLSPDTGQSKEKYFVLVSSDPKKTDPLFFFITTSKLEFYEKHPTLKNDIVVVEPGELGFFPVRTAISCRRIEGFSREVLEDRFADGKCSVLGEVSDTVLWEIDECIKRSTLLSDEEKTALLPPATK